MKKTLAAGITAISTTFGSAALANHNVTLINLDELLGTEVTMAIKGSGQLDTAQAQFIEIDTAATYNEALPVTMCYDLNNDGTLSESERDMREGYAVNATYNQALLVMNDGMLEPLRLDLIASEIAPNNNSATLRSTIAKMTIDTYKGIQGDSGVKAIAIANKKGDFESLFIRQSDGKISALAIGPKPETSVPAHGPCHVGPRTP